MKIIAVLVFVFFGMLQQTHASLVSWDAFAAGDGKAVKDLDSGLVWLSLDQVAGIDYVDAGSHFSGWEYASYQDVHALLDGFFPDIMYSAGNGQLYNYEQNCANTTSCYSKAQDWQNLFGSVANVDRNYQTWSLGRYADENGQIRAGGSYLNGSATANLYGSEFSVNYSNGVSEFERIHFSTFLVKSDSIQVSAPASSMIFMAFGLALFRRKAK